MRLALIAFMAVNLAVVGCAPKSRLKVGKTAQGEVVDAEGVVPLQRNDLPATEAAALAAAQRSAVEKVVGVYISGKTLVEKAVLVESRILTKTNGYISKYDIISKGPEGDFYRMKIRALVLMQAIADDLRDAGILDVGGVGNPRVAVLLEENVDGAPADSIEGAQAVTQSLLRRGYTVVDRSAIAGAAASAILEAVGKGDTKKVGDLGTAIGAEIVITGLASATQLKDVDDKLGGLVSYRARASLQASRAGTGQVLGSISRDASGLDATKGLASAKALASASSMAAEELGASVYSALQAGVEIAISLHGITKLESLQRFQEELRSTAGAGKVLLRRFSEGNADISLVGSSKSATEIAAHIARMKSVSVEVDTYSQSRVEATLKE